MAVRELQLEKPQAGRAVMSRQWRSWRATDREGVEVRSPPQRQGKVGRERSQVCDSGLAVTSVPSLIVRVDLAGLSG